MPSALVKNYLALKSVVNALAGLDPTDDKPWEVNWQPYKQTRSAAANRLYWAWVDYIADETGNVRDDVHESFKAMFLGSEIIEIRGKQMVHVRSTRDLKVKEFATYMTKIQAWCVDIGIVLPTNADYETVFR